MNEQPQDAGQQDQAEQGMAQQWDDATIKSILFDIYVDDVLSQDRFKYLCGALKIDIRDVT